MGLENAKAMYDDHRDACNTCNGSELCDVGFCLWDRWKIAEEQGIEQEELPEESGQLG